jgi:ubiquinone biosynthesis protein
LTNVVKVEGAGGVMIPGTFQIDPQDLAAVVPDCYAPFRPVVADGLTFFLRHLSPPRLVEIFQAQAELPADAGLPRRLVLFLHACPALHKLGQVVARNRHLDPELRRHLQELESLEPHTPPEQWRPALARELAPAVAEYRIRLGECALAEASVALVVPLTWSDPGDGADAPRRHGVAKLLKPGVVGRLDEDLNILGRLAGYLEERGAAYGLPPLAYREILDEVAELLAHEVRLRREQAHLRRAAEQFAGHSDVQVPRPLPFCTDALTGMERVYGCKVTDARALSGWRRPVLFLSAVRALLSGVLFSCDESVLFHGDPHAGNLMASDDGRLAILDWSLVGRLTADDRVQLAQILVGGLARDAARVAGAVARLAREGTAADLIRRHVEEALAALRWYSVPGPAWATGLLDALAGAGARFPPRLLLFRKAFLTLQGVLADVYPAGSPEAALMAEALVRLAWEWPARWYKPLDDRDHATHLSSADLMDLACGQARLFCLPAALGS